MYVHPVGLPVRFGSKRCLRQHVRLIIFLGGGRWALHFTADITKFCNQK